MATMKDKYVENMLETPDDHNDRPNAPLSNEKLRQEVSKVMSETESEPLNVIRRKTNHNVFTKISTK